MILIPYMVSTEHRKKHEHSLYEKYMNTNNCENCDIELVRGAGLSNKKHLDHDHNGGLFRNVLCGNCNIKRKE